MNQKALLRSNKNKASEVRCSWVLDGLDSLTDLLLPSNGLGVWTLGFPIQP